MQKEEFTQEALKFLDALHHFAVRLTRSADSAADLVQETYLKAIDHQYQYAAGTNLKAWMFTILKNIHINRAVRAKREESLDDSQEVHQAGNVVSYSFGRPGDQLRWITQEDLENALAQLPDIFRETIILSDYEGFSYREIAKILDIPQGTVMSRLSRARRALRLRLAPYATGRAAHP